MKKRGRKKKDKFYFTEDTENAIVEYNNSTDQQERNRIYEKYIHYSFFKLSETILFTFKFKYFDIPPNEVIHEVMAFLLEKIHKYKKENGKAFSYFGQIVKNYLIFHNNKNFEKFKREILLSQSEKVWDLEDDFYARQKQKEFEEFNGLMIQYWDDNILHVFKKKRDIEIADAIIELFRKSQYIENHNKKALYLMIREMTGCKTQYITKVINKMKKKQAEIFDEYLTTGYVTLKQDFF